MDLELEVHRPGTVSVPMKDMNFELSSLPPQLAAALLCFDEDGASAKRARRRCVGGEACVRVFGLLRRILRSVPPPSRLLPPPGLPVFTPSPRPPTCCCGVFRSPESELGVQLVEDKPPKWALR